jgi:hypothetical protein
MNGLGDMWVSSNIVNLLELKVITIRSNTIQRYKGCVELSMIVGNIFLSKYKIGMSYIKSQAKPGQTGSI